MRSFHRCAERALALSLSLTAAGAFCVVGPSLAATAAVGPVGPVGPTGPTGPTIGGSQLAARGVIVNLPPGVKPPPAMASASFLLADMDTGQILVARAPHAPHLPASTLKTLTALTLIPLLNPNARIVAKPQDVAVTGTHLGLVAGTTYSVSTLLQGMLMASGNDAAYALARANNGIPRTLAAMNATAAELGARDTVARDPSGLDHVGQRTSAYDLALIGRAAMKLPAFRLCAKAKQATLSGGRAADGRRRPNFQVSNHNKLLFNYPGAIGIKNGYTIAARFTYIEAATRGGHTYLVTQMADPKGGWRPAAALLNWAFANGPSLTPIGVLVEPPHALAATPGAPNPTTPNASTPPKTVATASLPRSPAATSTPRELARRLPLAVWIGLGGGLGALALVGVLARRSINRRRHQSR